MMELKPYYRYFPKREGNLFVLLIFIVFILDIPVSPHIRERETSQHAMMPL